MADRIRRGLSEPIDFGTRELEVTSSIGVVVTSDDSTASTHILQDADNAYYDANGPAAIRSSCTARHRRTRRTANGASTRRLRRGSARAESGDSW